MENYDVKDIVNLPFEKIDQIQELFNKRNLDIIDAAYKARRINQQERDYLVAIYQDGMSLYRGLYREIYELFRQPENTCAVDPVTGKVDVDENGNRINYGLKAVTPFTCTRLEYVDKFHNPIYVILPKMKSAERAVEKIESEYYPDYLEDMAKIADRFFNDEDRDAFSDSMHDMQHSATKVHDILRLTITCKYFSDVERIKRLMTQENPKQNRNYFINEKETRDLFLRPLNKNEKKYFDIKMIMHQKAPSGETIEVEVQLKIDTLYRADIRTHRIYEDVRQIEAELALSSQQMDPTLKRQKEAQVKILKNRIRTINENAIHQYNMMVLDKARRIEDDAYRPLRVAPDHKDGTYQQCRAVIANEYLVESFDKFDPQTAFDDHNPVNKLAFLRLIGKISDEFNETEDGAEEVIEKAFARLTPTEQERFNGINEIAVRYAPIIDQKIQKRQKEDDDEQEAEIPLYQRRESIAR